MCDGTVYEKLLMKKIDKYNLLCWTLYQVYE